MNSAQDVSKTIAYGSAKTANATASGLSNIFPTKDGERFVTLPHKVLSVDRDQLRAEIEARWQAFGKGADAGVH